MEKPWTRKYTFQYVQHITKFGGSKIMIWARIVYGFCTDIYFFWELVNGHTYSGDLYSLSLS